MTLGLLALAIFSYALRYLIPGRKPLPSPPWLVLIWLLRDWAILLAESCAALVVLRVAVLAWRRVRGHSESAPDVSGDAP